MKTAVLLSGGVDSSVALHLVKNREYVRAYYLKIWLEDEASFLGNCPWEDDIAAASAVCEQIGVELAIVPLQLAYYDSVVTYVLEELREGRTPSPDIFCNQRIKFGAFFEEIGDDVDQVVTGHYAGLRRFPDNWYHLFQAPDSIKDQTYFLSHVNQKQLSRLFFPLGNMHKHEVRSLARKLALPNMDRPDSQGMCFLGNIKYPQFLKHYLGTGQGSIVEKESGKVLGKHEGAWFYTIGQRKGLGLGGGPWYVVGKDPENTVYVSHQNEIHAAFHKSFICVNPNWICGTEPTSLGKKDIRLKLRHGPKMIGCRLQPLAKPSGSGGGLGKSFAVHMKEGDKGIAPGQFAVFYEGNECLGGAMIERVILLGSS